MTFGDYVSFYQLARSEGLVLRYLADAYKALKQTVPDEAKTDELQDLVEWLGELVRQVDSSLIDEWEKLRNPDDEDLQEQDDTPAGVTRNDRAFRVLVRNAFFRRVELASRRDYYELSQLDAADGWDYETWQEALAPYFEEHHELPAGPEARGPHLFIVEQQPERWLVRQIIDDPAGDHDWAISGEVDLAASDEAGNAVIHITEVGN
jgi:hypothetical protein